MLWKGEQDKPEDRKAREDRHRKLTADRRVLFEDAHYVLVADDEQQRKLAAIRERVDTYYKRTPLIVACMHGDCERMRCLLQQGADPTVPDRDGWTPLHAAALGGQAEAVSLLLQFGVDIEILNAQAGNITPMHQAAFSGSPQVVQVLYDHGADINRRSAPAPTVPQGDSALLRARRNLKRTQELHSAPHHNPAMEAAYARHLLETAGFLSPTIGSCAQVVELLVELGAAE